MSSPPYDLSPDGSLADQLFRKTRQAAERLAEGLPSQALGQAHVRQIDTSTPGAARRWARTSPWHKVPYDVCDGGIYSSAWLAEPTPDPDAGLLVTLCRPCVGGFQGVARLSDPAAHYVLSLDGTTQPIGHVLERLRQLLPDGTIEVDPVYQDITFWHTATTRVPIGGGLSLPVRGLIYRLLLFTPDQVQ